MPECEFLPNCPFFHEKLPSMPVMSQYLKSMYCQRDSSKCARYLVNQALGPGKVPADLFPDQINRARRIIEAG